MRVFLARKVLGAAVIGAMLAAGYGTLVVELTAAEAPLAPEPAWLAKLLRAPKEGPGHPPVKPRLPSAEFNYGLEKFTLHGASIVWDPINREALFLGGHQGGMPFGTAGSWAIAEDGKTWRALKFTSAALDPLYEKCRAARKPAQEGEAAARNAFYASVETAELKARLAKLIAEAVRRTEELRSALAAVQFEGWEKESVARATPLVDQALSGLKAAQDGLVAGKLDAALLKHCFTAQWALDEAAACLATSPGPRRGAAAAYDPDTKCVVLFGGDHGDYVLADTWIYDCTKKSWRQVWPKATPAPRCDASLKWIEGKKQLVLAGGQTVLPRFDYYVHYQPAPTGDWSFDAKTGAWTGQAGAAAAPRTYRSIVSAYDPCWYDAAPRGNPVETAKGLAALKPNTWTRAPAQDRPAPERDWGTAALDPDRDQIYRWTGGHCADHGSNVSTYHPAINRWSIPYVAEIFGKGMSFNGRPDCYNHTYLHYAYDTVSKRLICTSMGGTAVYNPDIRDFEFSVDQPFNQHVYLTCTISTARGVVVWTQYGSLYLFDYQAKAWKPLPVKGKMPAPQVDGSLIAYDSKRNALYMASVAGWEKPFQNLWRYDMATGEVKAMDPAGSKEFGPHIKVMRESIYHPKTDLVLFNNFLNNQQLAYDPEKNRLVLLNIGKDAERAGEIGAANLGGVSMGMVYDAKRDLVWGLGSYKKNFVLNIDPKTLVVTGP